MPFRYVLNNGKPITVTSSSIFKTFFSRLFSGFRNTKIYLNFFFPVRGGTPQTINYVDVLVNDTIPNLQKQGASYKEIKEKILNELNNISSENSYNNKVKLYELLIDLGSKNNDVTVRDTYKKLLMEHSQNYGPNTEKFYNTLEDFYKYIIKTENINLNNIDRESIEVIGNAIVKEITSMKTKWFKDDPIMLAASQKLNELLLHLNYINITEISKPEFSLEDILTDNQPEVIRANDIVFSHEVKIVNPNEPILVPGLEMGNIVVSIRNDDKNIVINQPQNVDLEILVFQIEENFKSDQGLQINIFYKDKTTEDGKEKFEEFLSNFENEMARQLEKENFVVNQKQIAVTNNESIIIPGSTETLVFDEFDHGFLYNTDTWILNLRKKIFVKNFESSNNKWVVLSQLETLSPKEIIELYSLTDDDIINVLIDHKKINFIDPSEEWKDYINKSLNEKIENISGNIEILTKLYEVTRYDGDNSIENWRIKFESKLAETIKSDPIIFNDNFDFVILVATPLLDTKISPTKQKLIETLLEVIKPETIQTHPAEAIEFYNDLIKNRKELSSEKMKSFREKMLNLFISGDIKNANYINVDQQRRKMKNFVLSTIDPETKVENYHLINNRKIAMLINDIMSYAKEQNVKEEDISKLTKFKDTILAKDRLNNINMSLNIRDKLNDYIITQLSADRNITRINKELFDLIKSRNPNLANLTLENFKVNYSSINASIDHIDMPYNIGKEEHIITLPINELHQITDIMSHIAPIRESFYMVHH